MNRLYTISLLAALACAAPGKVAAQSLAASEQTPAATAQTPANSAPSSAVRTSSIEEVLTAIASNNPALAALGREAEAQSLEVKNSNLPEDPSVEYSSFYANGLSGQAGSELVVSQGFDFPTLYSARRQRNELTREAIGSTLDSDRRAILLEARNLCLDIITFRQIDNLLATRAEMAQELLDLFQQRLEAGDASILEVNKIKVELMDVATEVAANRSALDAACRSLTAMNGGTALIFESDYFPIAEPIADYENMVSEYLDTDASLRAADAAARAARKDISVNRQGWIPKLEVGYRRNTAIREAEHGFLVGGSFPIFSNQKKVAMAKARSASASSALTGARLQAEAEVRTLLGDIDRTKAALDAYDEPLMRETLALLGQAVESGEISIIEYFVDSSSIYSALVSCINLRGEYHKLISSLYRNRL